MEEGKGRLQIGQHSSVLGAEEEAETEEKTEEGAEEEGGTEGGTETEEKAGEESAESRFRCLETDCWTGFGSSALFGGVG